MVEQPKLLLGCIQNGVRRGCIKAALVYVNVVPPANSSNLSYPVLYVELGKSVFLFDLLEKAKRE